VDCASHRYPDGSLGIHQMCFSVRRGEIVALCGSNGSGKSTLIEHLNGLLLPACGRVVVNGSEVGAGDCTDLWKTVGVVFQRSEDQLFAPTVLDDVMFGLRNLGLPLEEARERAQNTLDLLGAGDIAPKMPNYVSGGQRRLAAIAGVLAMRPAVIALDEPTSDLDPRHTAIIEEAVRSIRERDGISVVLATHDLDLAARLADRVCIIHNGSIIAEGTPQEVFHDEQALSIAGLAPPLVVTLYRDLCRQGLAQPGMFPVTPDELVAHLSGISRDHVPGRNGLAGGAEAEYHESTGR
jgi:cobalt/nickel transport system ATP-binding protein